MTSVSDTPDEPATDKRNREVWSRTFALDDIKILTRAQGHGDGRTVEAYAAVFNVPQEIQDEHGHYMETNHPTVFNKTLADGAITRAMCLYHHGMNVVDSKPNPMAQVPLGRPLEIKPDSKGLLTVTRYNKSDLADSVLESIKNGDIRAQSFRGRIYRSNPERIPRVRHGQPLPNVTRMELGLSDYGPTPRPYYADAGIVAVRAQDLMSDIEQMDPEERAELLRMLGATPEEPAPEPTPDTGAGTEEPPVHSARSHLLRLKAEALFMGARR